MAQLPEIISQVLDIFLHLDQHLNAWAGQLGPGLYIILFLIVFCETGLVVTPFLPGDSLLFAVGALSAADGSPIHVGLVSVLLIIAAIIGDAVNYAIGSRLGPKVFTREDSLFFNKKHLLKTQEFYEKHGGKTIVFARFIPIIRTFAPFVAGIGKMQYRSFAFYNVFGAFVWVIGFVAAGFFFGNLAFVKRNFQYVILAIIILSVMPPVIEWLRSRRANKAAEQPVANS